ncbi:MAG: hypothetical protein JHD16_00415 [Solirubrobacteraceae bacterium]|nr:hypothetical protein [Solirubrobacteraceae bacterium]
MGWTGGPAPKPRTARNLIAFDLGETFAERVVATHKDGTTIYAAFRSEDGNEVFGLVLLTDSGPGGIVYTKPVTEDMGPAEDRCPIRILDLLTDTDSDYALNWRQRCRDRASRPRPKKGQKVRFAEPLAFTNGDRVSDFTYQGGSRFAADGREYHISRWRDQRFTILEA